jgi:hypothetical protein
MKYVIFVIFSESLSNGHGSKKCRRWVKNEGKRSRDNVRLLQTERKSEAVKEGTTNVYIHEGQIQEIML